MVGDGDAELRALPLDFCLAGAGLLQRLPMPGDGTLVPARLAIEPARLSDQAVGVAHHCL